VPLSALAPQIERPGQIPDSPEMFKLEAVFPGACCFTATLLISKCRGSSEDSNNPLARLEAGANDFGGTLMEESTSKAAGAKFGEYGLDWPCCGSEFILSKAEETLRYAAEKERRRGKLSSDYWFARVGRCRHRVL
jgi:hypothetical protein